MSWGRRAIVATAVEVEQDLLSLDGLWANPVELASSWKLFDFQRDLELSAML